MIGVYKWYFQGHSISLDIDIHPIIMDYTLPNFIFKINFRLVPFIDGDGVPSKGRDHDPHNSNIDSEEWASIEFHSNIFNEIYPQDWLDDYFISGPISNI